MRSPLPQAPREGEGGDGSSSGNKKARTACCTKVGLKRGPWTAEEDELLSNYVKKEGEGKWRTMPNKAGLLRCGKSCRLRWMNYLRPSVKRGDISEDEEDLILRLHRLLGNRWSLIAGRIPGRTDNEIKNYWNTHLSKKLIGQGIDPKTHKPLLNPTNNIIGNKQDYSPNSSLYISDFSNTVLGKVETLHENTEYCVEHVDGSKKDQMVIERNEGTSNEKYHEEDFDLDFFMPDEAFSSFLNSLINDEMFNAGNMKHQMEEEKQ